MGALSRCGLPTPLAHSLATFIPVSGPTSVGAPVTHGMRTEMVAVSQHSAPPTTTLGRLLWLSLPWALKHRPRAVQWAAPAHSPTHGRPSMEPWTLDGVQLPHSRPSAGPYLSPGGVKGPQPRASLPQGTEGPGCPRHGKGPWWTGPQSLEAAASQLLWMVQGLTPGKITQRAQRPVRRSYN